MNEAEAGDCALAHIKAAAAALRGNAPPRDCGHFDIHIDRNGSWFYRGTPINRASLVRLFSTLLTRDQNGVYWLSTPAQRGRITVEEVPFLAVELDLCGEGRDQALIFRTNVDEFVTAGAQHPLRVETDPETWMPRPYLCVRNGLDARLLRPVFYTLVELGREEWIGGTTEFGVWSEGRFFSLGRLTDEE